MASNVSFSLMGATEKTYKEFITNLRKELTPKPQKVYNIPVLAATAPKGLSQFVLVNLTNYKAESITVAINKVDVYVVAYKAGNKAYFLKDVPKEAQDSLFKGIPRETLPFKGNYDDLERFAGKISRENIELGFSEFGSSIGNLFHYNAVGNSVPRSFIVVIQTVSEAARFKYIEYMISKNVATKFEPDPGFLSLQNRWSNLSEQIQKAVKRGGKFEHPVQVRSISNKPVLVSDVDSLVVKGMALLLYDKGQIMKAFQGLNNNNNNNSQWEKARGTFGIDF